MALVKKGCVFLGLMLCGYLAQAQQKNVLQRTINWSYKLVQGDSAHPKKKYFFAVPIISYKPETRWQFGLSLSHYFRAKSTDSLTRPSVIRLNSTYTQNHQFSIRPMFDVFTAGNKYSIRGLFQYTQFVENYWGVGRNLPSSNKESYSFKQHKAMVKVAKKFKQGLYLGADVNYENLYDLTYAETSTLKNANITGNHGYHVLGIGPILTFDTRNNLYYPNQGHFIDVAATVYSKQVLSSSSFQNITVDARKYYALNNTDVLAVQCYTNFNWGNVPYRLMGTLGNESYFRGYYQGRYRDINAITLQAEWRKHIWGPAGIVLFGGAGNVSANYANLVSHIKPMYGAGLRIMAIPREKINMRFDVAFGSQNSQTFYVTLNEAF